MANNDSSWLYPLISHINDPELGASVLDLGIAKELTYESEHRMVTVQLALTTIACPLRSELQRSIRSALIEHDLIDLVEFDVIEMDSSQRSQAMRVARAQAAKRDKTSNLPPDAHVLAISSGKGGVGKSTTTVNLARALAQQGHNVGLLDADIWGFSIPRLLELPTAKLEATGTKDNWKIAPHRTPLGKGSLSVVSMGMLAESDQSAIMWRGLMLSRALEHFINDVSWGDISYLLIDMPPGTGDIQLTLARLVPSTVVVLVTTPDIGASAVAVRAGDMAIRSNLEVLGVVENMSYFSCDHGTPYDIFGSGGGDNVAKSLAIDLLGKIPLATESSSTSQLAEVFDQLATQIETRLERRDHAMSGCTARMIAALNAAVATV